MPLQKSNNNSRPVAIIPTFGETIRRFVKLESSGGIILMIATVLAMIVKNSPMTELYTEFLNLRGAVSIGPLEISKPLFLWVNDAWMAIFFFLVGMEIKREILYGYLSNKSQLILPAAAAVGGMAIPGLIYYVLNAADPVAAQGWAIPTATDIAFALGVLALLGNRVPVALKVFLMTLAVLDDLGAIVIIALFYTSNLSATALIAGAVCLFALLVVNRTGVRHTAPYILIGMALWICVLKSGVHATLAGVITALMMPGRANSADNTSPLEHTIEILHPWVAFAVLPMFAFVNAGISFAGLSAGALLEPLPLGIILGLVVGKPVGVVVFSAVVVFTRLSVLPPGITWRTLAGVAFLCGIGFTMSIFVASLAFEEVGIGYAKIDRLAIIAASLASGLVGYFILRLSLRPKTG